MKRPRDSKTVGFNVAVILAGLVPLLSEYIAGLSPDDIPSDVAGTILVVLGAVGVVLRFLTKEPLGREP